MTTDFFSNKLSLLKGKFNWLLVHMSSNQWHLSLVADRYNFSFLNGVQMIGFDCRFWPISNDLQIFHFTILKITRSNASKVVNLQFNGVKLIWQLTNEIDVPNSVICNFIRSITDVCQQSESLVVENSFFFAVS